MRSVREARLRSTGVCRGTSPLEDQGSGEELLSQTESSPAKSATSSRMTGSGSTPPAICSCKTPRNLAGKEGGQLEGTGTILTAEGPGIDAEDLVELGED